MSLGLSNGDARSCGGVSSSNTSSAAPAIVRGCRTCIRAASSMIGPREVLISRAVGFTASPAPVPLDGLYHNYIDARTCQ